MKYGNFNRVLFLVDRNNLGDQTLREFRDFSTPDDGRKFTELYNAANSRQPGWRVDKSCDLHDSTGVSVLRGHEVPDEDDDGIDDYTPDAPVTVEYNPDLPPEAFDLIIVMNATARCMVWRGVPEYFDAHLAVNSNTNKADFGFSNKTSCSNTPIRR